MFVQLERGLSIVVQLESVIRLIARDCTACQFDEAATAAGVRLQYRSPTAP